MPCSVSRSISTRGMVGMAPVAATGWIRAGTDTGRTRRLRMTSAVCMVFSFVVVRSWFGSGERDDVSHHVRHDEWPEVTQFEVEERRAETVCPSGQHSGSAILPMHE